MSRTNRLSLLPVSLQAWKMMAFVGHPSLSQVHGRPLLNLWPYFSQHLSARCTNVPVVSDMMCTLVSIAIVYHWYVLLVVKADLWAIHVNGSICLFLHAPHLILLCWWRYRGNSEILAILKMLNSSFCSLQMKSEDSDSKECTALTFLLGSIYRSYTNGRKGLGAGWRLFP